jgi:hypothetical protein
MRLVHGAQESAACTYNNSGQEKKSQSLKLRLSVRWFNSFY